MEDIESYNGESTDDYYNIKSITTFDTTKLHNINNIIIIGKNRIQVQLLTKNLLNYGHFSSGVIIGNFDTIYSSEIYSEYMQNNNINVYNCEQIEDVLKKNYCERKQNKDENVKGVCVLDYCMHYLPHNIKQSTLLKHMFMNRLSLKLTNIISLPNPIWGMPKTLRDNTNYIFIICDSDMIMRTREQLYVHFASNCLNVMVFNKIIDKYIAPSDAHNCIVIDCNQTNTNINDVIFLHKI